jgi:hypothetical protein
LRLGEADNYEIKHNLAGNKAYLGRARMTRWWESAGELWGFHLGGDGLSFDECIGDLSSVENHI